MKYKYSISIYYKNKFIGYVKDYRMKRNHRYSFNKTKNINKSLKFLGKVECDSAQFKLENFKDEIYYKDYTFEVTTITKQEIRKSKLSYLKTVKPKYGLFKLKIN